MIRVAIPVTRQSDNGFADDIAHVVAVGLAGRPLDAGRIATAEGRVTDVAGKLIAHGTETCMIFNAPAASGV